MSADIVKVGMADLKIAFYPQVLVTLGLGSCVGLVLYDEKIRIGGMAHIMLPSSKIVTTGNVNEAKFADTAIEKLLFLLKESGVDMLNLKAKIAGGAQMFANKNGASDMLKIGQKNADQVLQILNEKKIKVLAQDTGGNYGRTIELHTETGNLLIKTIGHGVKQI